MAKDTQKHAASADRSAKLAALVAQSSPRDMEVKAATEAVLAEAAVEIRAAETEPVKAIKKTSTTVCRESISMSPEEQDHLNSMVIKITALLNKPIPKSVLMRAALTAFAQSTEAQQINYVKKAMQHAKA